MNLKDQVCLIEQAKKLNKLGIKYDSYFYYAEYQDDYLKEHNIIIFDKNNEIVDNSRKDIMRSLYTEKAVLFYPAFSVAELDELLPKKLFLEDHGTMFISKDALYHGVSLYQLYPNGYNHEYFETGYIESAGSNATLKNKYYEKYGDTEAESKANLLLFLLETEKVNIEDINSNKNKYYDN